MNDRQQYRRDEQASDLLDAVRRAARQEQFLEVVSAEEARTRFAQHLDLTPLPAEPVALADALNRVLAHDVAAPVDAPPFDRASVDGFAVAAADTAGATDAAPRRLVLNAEVLTCGRPPSLAVARGTATAIATGGVVPRGADAVVMVEHTELVETAAGPAIDVHRAAAPGQFVAFAGSDIARGETLLRRGTLIGSREIGMLAACGIAAVDVVRRPKVGVMSTGDELVAPGGGLRPGAVYDSNGAIIAAAVAEAGGEAVPFGAYADDEAVLEQAVRRALATCDMVVLSGGTSKGAGDLSYRIVSRLGAPGVIVHGVALKPGKPLCLAVGRGKAHRGAARVSHLGDLHLPQLRRAGDPRPCRPRCRGRADRGCDHSGARRLGARAQGVRAGVARARRGRPGGVSDRQGLGLGDELLAVRRFHRGRCARHCGRCRHGRQA